MKPAKWAVVDRFVVRNPVAQQVEVPHGVVYVAAHSSASDARESVAEAWQP
jgi:hypothetical protein